RNIDGAARDVQAAINAALTDLPADLPSSPAFRKSNPAATPIMILALTSSNLPPSVLYDAADSVIAQRLSQIEGVAEVTVTGAEQPAVRVRVDPVALASMGLALEDVRTAIANTNAVGPIGAFNGSERAITMATNDQLRTAAQYDPVVVRRANGAVVRLSAVASIQLGVRDRRAACTPPRRLSVAATHRPAPPPRRARAPGPRPPRARPSSCCRSAGGRFARGCPPALSRCSPPSFWSCWSWSI